MTGLPFLLVTLAILGAAIMMLLDDLHPDDVWDDEEDSNRWG